MPRKTLFTLPRNGLFTLVRNELFTLRGISKTTTKNEMPFNIGRQKLDVKKQLNKDGLNYTEGITNEGLTFVMVEDRSDMNSWYFNDDLICVANYSVSRSVKGRELMVFIRDFVAKDGSKVDTNLYLYDGLHYKFGNNSDGGLTLLVDKRN